MRYFRWLERKKTMLTHLDQVSSCKVWVDWQELTLICVVEDPLFEVANLN